MRYQVNDKSDKTVLHSIVLSRHLVHRKVNETSSTGIPLKLSDLVFFCSTLSEKLRAMTR